MFRHARALCAVTSPTVNCYKRLQVGAGLTGTRSGYTWTPASITFGDNNRTQMVRTASPGHFEDRTISAACNPYLALAVYVAAGLDGIEKKLDPGEPEERNIYEALEAGKEVKRLPMTFGAALEALEGDDVVKSALPGDMYRVFMHYKRDEWERYCAQVSDWDVTEYLDVLP